MILYVFIFVLLVAYAYIVVYFGVAWRATPLFTAVEQTGSQFFSIIIPARNEEYTLPQLLRALQQQDYPGNQFEVIVVDDHSTDQTAAVAAQFEFVHLIRLTEDGINSYKKKAVETGVKAARHPWIVCTDADCVPGPAWLRAISAAIDTADPVFIAAPVCINNNRTLVQLFQAADFIMLQGITGAAVHQKKLSMCNGANLAYRKMAFEKVGGFAGIDDIASGDDMLLMHKIAKEYPGRTYYLKSTEAIMHTAPVTTWRGFFSQRIRWASKATHYRDRRIFFVLLLVYLFNICFPVLAIAGIWNRQYWLALAVLWLIKTLVELPLFSDASRFFSRQWLVPYFFFLQPLHIAYTLLSGFLGVITNYEWKGRRVR